MVEPTAAPGKGSCLQGGHQATGSKPGEQRTKTKKGTPVKSGLGHRKRGGGEQTKRTKAGFIGLSWWQGCPAGEAGTRWAHPTAPLPRLCLAGWREMETLTPSCSCRSHMPPLLPSLGPGGSCGVPAPRRSLPAVRGGRLSHIRTLAPEPEGGSERQKKPSRDTRILLPPGPGGEKAPRSLPGVSRAPHAAPEPCPSLLASPAPGCPRRRAAARRERGWQLPPSPGPACPSLTESTAGQDPPWSHGLETRCSWQLPGASAAWPSAGRGEWQQAPGALEGRGGPGDAKASRSSCINQALPRGQSKAQRCCTTPLAPGSGLGHSTTERCGLEGPLEVI